ncbi:MAG: hypothetical protein GEV03_00010 [Streptosporangiales bacterium]|nr:hypothetical protein [Streptosporangiales bacterium]
MILSQSSSGGNPCGAQAACSGRMLIIRIDPFIPWAMPADAAALPKSARSVARRRGGRSLMCAIFDIPVVALLITRGTARDWLIGVVVVVLFSSYVVLL